eukprot:TRINITY_DN2252_c0_g1_i1.p1 TRINITY_DN2252_c0_g1~~TRINITY_DN2252_c0_g1_i1.p1  ORF type:complete len:145 (+),score=38.23 TRINITY_DN2252_c0_g1_i1:566-1000(+)
MQRLSALSRVQQNLGRFVNSTSTNFSRTLLLRGNEKKIKHEDWIAEGHDIESVRREAKREMRLKQLQEDLNKVTDRLILEAIREIQEEDELERLALEGKKKETKKEKKEREQKGVKGDIDVDEYLKKKNLQRKDKNKESKNVWH